MDSLRARVPPQGPAGVCPDVSVLDVPVVGARHAAAAHVLLPRGAGLAVHAAVHHAAHAHPEEPVFCTVHVYSLLYTCTLYYTCVFCTVHVYSVQYMCTLYSTCVLCTVHVYSVSPVAHFALGHGLTHCSDHPSQLVARHTRVLGGLTQSVGHILYMRMRM